MTYKIIFFDVDGTLIDYKNGRISATTISAIQQLQANEIQVVAATGRPLSMCTELQALGMETFITANGAYAKHGESVIYESVLDKDIVAAITAYAGHKGHALSYFTEALSMNGIHNAPTFHALQQTLSLQDYPEVDPFITEKDLYLMCLYAEKQAVEEALPRNQSVSLEGHNDARHGNIAEGRIPQQCGQGQNGQGEIFFCAQLVITVSPSHKAPYTPHRSASALRGFPVQGFVRPGGRESGLRRLPWTADGQSSARCTCRGFCAVPP